ncbi:MFS transporter [Lacisediminimonas sp.]|uniref:MFS transporter n=1 Tax=Lacisediminimonas sp. TaxID=3060582 RepID=UPI00272047A3|nr:MFS transporter [Lacisediminimonas sp.]MDO8300707.1 MFS transporter [Lacisediminimonas sp.]MDO9218545.1 MFS transporter [Lacisediminimonas sp.]
MRELVIVPIRRLFGFTLLVLLLSQALVSWFAWSTIEEKIRPELDLKAKAVSISLGEKVKRALEYGIPFDRLNGVEAFFDDVLRDNTDLGFIALTDTAGNVLFASGVSAARLQAAIGKTPKEEAGKPVTLHVAAGPGGGDNRVFYDTRSPFEHQARTLGVIHVGVDQAFVTARISGLRYDIGIVLLTSMLIAFEILLFIVSLNYLEPMRQVAEMMARMARGDFSNKAVVSVKESIGSLAERLNGIGDRVNQGFHELVHAAPARNGAGQSGDNRHDTHRSLLQQLRARYVFAEGGIAGSLVQQRVVTIRILTFLFMFAEMLSRSFLPIYVGSLPDPGLGLSPDLVASLPITANLLCVALSLPFAGRWSDQLGRRSSYVLGAAVLMIGLITAGIGGHFLLLLLGRMVSGVGYAILYMACQGYVVDNTTTTNRSQGMAAFVSAIMVAEICAPAVGGILADRIGYQMVFILGAVTAVLASLLAVRTLDDRSARRAGAPQPAGASSLGLLLRNHRFIAVSVLAGVPAKLLLSGFLIYLVPVILTGMQATPAEIGRYAMIYGVLTLSLGPLFARLADRLDAHVWAVAAGGLISGAGLLAILFDTATWPVLAGITALGIGQALSISAQLGLVTRVTQQEMDTTSASSVLGVYRLIERLGGALGPILAGTLVAFYGAARSMAVLGGFAVVTALLFLLVFALGKRKSDSRGHALEGGPA